MSSLPPTTPSRPWSLRAAKSWEFGESAFKLAGFTVAALLVAALLLAAAGVGMLTVEFRGGLRTEGDIKKVSEAATQIAGRSAAATALAKLLPSG